MANFCIKIAQGKYSKLSVIMYRLLLNLNTNSEYELPWIKTFQNIVYEICLSNVWHFPNVVNHKWLNNCRKIRLHDEYIQTWSSNVLHNDKCITYRIFKEVFEFESYLTLLPERLRIIFTQFRLCNTKLPIETGRWFNIDRNERHCILCNIKEIGDEFHLLFQCDTLRDQINRFLTRYFINRPNSFKFSVLFNIHILNKLIKMASLSQRRISFGFLKYIYLTRPMRHVQIKHVSLTIS